MGTSDTPAASGKTTVTTTPQAIVITRTFDAPRELVFRAWTEPELLKQWWGPKGFTTPVLTVDPRPGGLFHYCMRSPDGHEYWGRGVFREVVPPERLVRVDSLADEQGNPVPAERYGFNAAHPLETLVTVTFDERGGRTTVTLRHEIPASVPERSRAAEGYRQSLDRLADLLAVA
jgi:uncharacterized protein YndB with AHSA1/START domain